MEEFPDDVINQTSLIIFIVSEWRKAENRKKLNEKVLYVTANDKYYRITGTSGYSDLLGGYRCFHHVFGIP